MFFLKQEHLAVLHFDLQLHVISSTQASGIEGSLVQTAVKDSVSFFQTVVAIGDGISMCSLIACYEIFA